MLMFFFFCDPFNLVLAGATPSNQICALLIFHFRAETLLAIVFSLLLHFNFQVSVSADLIFVRDSTDCIHGEKSVKNLNNLWSFIEMFAAFVLNLCGEKMTNMRSA